ncbi:transporter substrate-binding domain-containing protein [Pseudomonas benzenivorans]|uniref:Transporter substrate-binding domain-containing protein n=1 Tax=Pseudomonas benzenivorans TaxID=556533 RepID=A0ABY5HEZ0_9PSED|nr:transporter substrate-binding domain-containing protein [Pseudomonas benzenivorans]
MHCCLSVLLLGLWLAPPLSGEPLRLYSQEYPPVNFSVAGEPAGMAVEVVRELARRSGQPISLEVVPWARAYREARTRPNAGVFVAMRTAEREPLFQWVGPITVNSTGFYGLNDFTPRIDTLEDARHHGQIAIPREWYSHQLLLAEGFTNLHPVPGPDMVVQMLKHRRVKLMVMDNLGLPAYLARGGLRDDEVKLLFSFLRSYSYIAFSPETDPSVVARWQEELDGMKRDGSFATIHHKWLPGAEMPGLRAPP